MFKLTLRNKKAQHNTNGFTIIEVALVLAIAAMIFLVVFLAVPALQRNQRDDARKRDVANVVAAVETYHANAGNPTLSGNTFVYKSNDPSVKSNSKLGAYIDQLSKNVDCISIYDSYSQHGQSFNRVHPSQSNGCDNSTFGSQALNSIQIFNGTKCFVGDKPVYTTGEADSGVTPASPRSAAVVIQLESGGSRAARFYCQDVS